jgi:citrate lyase subunit beta/citryl-CoA lyase
VIKGLRSLLFVPGTRRDRFAKAIASGADAVIFDLEDSVQPASKDQARNAVAEFLSSVRSSDRSSDRSSECQWLVRINAFGTPWIDRDLSFIREHRSIDGVVLPKTETAAQVEEAARALPAGHVIPLLETSRGVLNALAIASAGVSVPALIFGAEDLTAQLGVPRTVDGEELLFARSQIVLAASAVGADAIDTVFTKVNDDNLLRQDALRARALGFRGKLAIHPSQIDIINEIFSPSEAEIDRARRIVEAYDGTSAHHQGVIAWEGEMIDAPVVLRARRVLVVAELREASAARFRQADPGKRP